MAQKFQSPGVSLTEVDQSFLAQGVAGVGAAVIGRTLKGPAYVPTLTTGFDDFVDRFGSVDTQLQAPYAAKNYLRNAGALTQVRILGHDDGTTVTNGYQVGQVTAITDSASNGKILAVIHHSGTIAVTGVPLDSNKFIVAIAGTVFAATASFQTSSDQYIGKVMNTDPTKYSTYGHYVYQVFPYRKQAASASWSTVVAAGSASDFRRNYEPGYTTWVKSQPLGGLEFNLFRFVTLPDGRVTNSDTKVEIGNVKPSQAPSATPYGTFDVRVRQFSDTDQKQVILESFVGCNLDPSSENYVARRIGDYFESFSTTQRKFVAQGEFRNRSRYIRIEMDTTQNAPAEALPFGHRGYSKLAFTNGHTIGDMPYTQSQKDKNGNIDAGIRFGISYVSGGIVDRMRANPNAATTVTDTDFSLRYLTGTYLNGKQIFVYDPTITQANEYVAVYASSSMHNFTLPFAGGFDGFDLRVKDPLYLANSADETDIGVVSLKRAIDALSNPDQFDMNLLALPAIHNVKVTDYARQMVNDRKDVFYVMDLTGSSVDEAVGLLRSREIDDNYTGVYYPDLKMDDKTNKRMVRVAPSVAVLGAMAFSDKVGQVFFAPAGMSRGGLSQFDIVDVCDRLDHEDRNVLYDNRINPIATFPNEGIVVFGQKTLQVKASALDRINVRRLMIYAKKAVQAVAKTLVFEPNNPLVWQRFTNAVNPILDRIRQDQGIVRFRVVMDTTTNTPDVVDRNVMVGKIFLQPTKTAEYLDISFIITNAGVEFGE